MKSLRRTVDLRQANTQVILRHLCFNGSMSRMEISQQTQLSPGTVTNVTSELLQSGVLIEKGLEESSGGRPRTIVDINPQYGYFIGVDLGETQVALELFDLKMNKLCTTVEPVTQEGDMLEQYIGILQHGCQDLIACGEISAEKILGVGIGVPGIVEHNGQVSVAAPMWGWQAKPLLDRIEKAVRLPVYIDNGAKAMALAESWFGAGRGVQDMAVILIGTGIGAGIITKGALYRGATNSAGEWGHTKVALHGRACRCGGKGCLEAYVGAPGILTSLREAGNSPQDDQFQAIGALVEAYQRGDVAAKRVMDDITLVLGVGIANLVNLFNPERIEIGGWAGLLIGEAVLDDLSACIKQNALPLSTKELYIGLCQLGQDAICTGAACLVLEEFLSANLKFNRGIY